MITRLRSLLSFRAQVALLPVFNFFTDLREFIGTAFLACWIRNGFALCTNPTGTFADGALIFGTQAITTVTGAKTFIASNIKIKRPSKRIETLGVAGVANKQAFMDEVPNGTLTLQLPDATTPAPARYDTFPLTPIGGGTAQVYIISEVGEEFESAGETKVPLTVYLALNGGTAQPA